MSLSSRVSSETQNLDTLAEATLLSHSLIPEASQTSGMSSVVFVLSEKGYVAM